MQITETNLADVLRYNEETVTGINMSLPAKREHMEKILRNNALKDISKLRRSVSHQVIARDNTKLRKKLRKIEDTEESGVFCMDRSQSLDILGGRKLKKLRKTLVTDSD